MSQELWTQIDTYLNGLLVPPDAALDGALASRAAAGMPAIDVAPNQGKLLHVLARAMGARAILEIGTLGGYSTIWLARALLPGGRLVTLEYDPRYAEVARVNLAQAGLATVVEVRVGAALDTLPQVEADGLAPFDLIFVDADKRNNPGYLEWALKLSRPGTLIIVDNVIRHGRIIDATSPDPDVAGTRAMFERMAAEPRLSATAVQLVGSKGLDGMALAVVSA